MSERAMVTEPSSSGWRSISSTLRGNSGNSSRNKHAVVRQADFAGPRHARAAADQPGIGDGVMRRAERPLAQQARAARQHAGDAVDLGGLDGFGKGQRRQDARPAAWPAWSCPIPAARSSARCARPPPPLRSARLAVVCPRTSRKSGAPESGADACESRRDRGREFVRPRDQRHHLGQMPHAEDAHAFHHRRLGGIFQRAASELAMPCVARAHRHRERAAHRPDGAIERQARPPADDDPAPATVPMAPRIPMAIGRSKPAPSLRTLAGARLMVTALLG